MPEVLEAELTRHAAGASVGRRIVAVERTDPLAVSDGVDRAVLGLTIERVDRHGTLLPTTTIRRRLPVMLRRGGSHTGTLSPDVRAGGGPCTRCGDELVRTVMGGRTTIWCRGHQR